MVMLCNHGACYDFLPKNIPIIWIARLNPFQKSNIFEVHINGLKNIQKHRHNIQRLVLFDNLNFSNFKNPDSPTIQHITNSLNCECISYNLFLSLCKCDILSQNLKPRQSYTTGFLAFLMAIEQYENYNVKLVGFTGHHSNSFKKQAQFHPVDIEFKVYERMNIPILFPSKESIQKI